MSMDLNQLVVDVKLTKACRIKADKDSTESKLINLVVNFTGITLMAIFRKALSSVVIQWQNGPGRKHFATWKNGQTVEVTFSSPGRDAGEDTFSTFVSATAGMSDAEALAFFRAEAAKRGLSTKVPTPTTAAVTPTVDGELTEEDLELLEEEEETA